MRVNRMIRVPQVRVVDADGNQLGIMNTEDALRMAMEAGLDLVEVAANARPPVCRIMDYGKFKYLQSKKAREARKRQTVIQIKEVKFRVRTEEHDFQFKMRNARKFLEAGNKVRVYVHFRGREITHPDLGRKLLDRVAAEVKDIAAIDSPPKIEGRRMTMLLAPLQAKAK